MMQLFKKHYTKRNKNELIVLNPKMLQTKAKNNIRKMKR